MKITTILVGKKKLKERFMEIYAKDSQDKSTIFVDNHKLIGVEGETIQNLVQSSIEKGIKEVIVDLSKVEYIASWGIGILVHAYTTCHNKKVGFSLQGVNPQVMNVLSQLKLTTLFNIK
jgi:anti-anti-sigma factor